MGRPERIERRLKLHDLRVLMTVVELGSMGKAAKALATSQPAVSRAVADLEHSLGVLLLDRTPGGIVATPYGNAIIRRGVAIFDELNQGVKDIDFLADPTTGEVRIAAPIVFAAGFVAAAIDRFALRYPDVTCHLTVGEAPTAQGALEERSVDLVIARFVGPIPGDHIRIESLYGDSQFVVASAENPLARRRKVGLAQLRDEPWAMPPPDTLLGAAFLQCFRQARLDPPRAAVVTFTDVARLALVAQGRFLTIVSESSLRFVGGAIPVKILPIDLPGTTRPVGIMTLRNRTLAPVAQLFIDCARELAKPLATASSSRARGRH